ncbi:LysR family transcriptional regulator ArgP [Rhizobium sp. SL86]|uniref:LysR family transcriptional regulator ArgP n=1 Tax=Rhizobium sp. SL86 TaxID=2995148 RepID=UPI0022746E84|nr:LysR family transcriptional regulator ArgP [Rhizobium sp. SL86]MCY1668167.1 LysR family transcriptional regulator ArgP [Rhizobium sp. SL86]
MLDYAALAAVAAVVQTGSFERAANLLHVTPSAVSQRVKQLEERLGTVLIIRGQPCSATEQGAWLCRHVEHVGMLEKELLQNLPPLADREAPALKVTLHLATNADSLGTWFLSAISDFANASDYLLKIEVDDQEHTAEWLQKGRVLAAVTGHGKQVQGCRMTRLGSLRYHATASPAFVARHFADGVNAASLSQAPALTYNQKDRLQEQWIHQVCGRSVNYPTHWLPSTHAFVEASLIGTGWGMNPAVLVKDHLKSGRLIDLSPGTVLDVPLYWQVNRMVDDQLSGLTQAVIAAARAALV